MDTPKRKAAAKVFAEQNQVAYSKSEEADLDFFNDLPILRESDDDPRDEPMAQQRSRFSGGGLPPTPKPSSPPAAAIGRALNVAPPPAPPQAIPAPLPMLPQAEAEELMKTSEELQIEKEPPRVRETGFLWWRRVIVPPNVYVVHTRIGRREPVTLGLGVSFAYNPFTDAYLIVPAAMQTIGVLANCISREKQGINVLAYVQWQIQDFATAYRRLDFSDTRDPLGIVNAQLREQAEAAIKDKIATMSIEDVLTDKEPIIEELTTRLKTVSEGRGGGDEGLGIKIVTVQLKEAVVSSKRLWEHLQMPFRVEKEKLAQLSQLEAQEEIRQRELATRQSKETSEAETLTAIERIKQTKQTEALELRVAQEALRFDREQEALRDKIRLEEQTTLSQRESQARLAAQSAQSEQDRVLREARLKQQRELQQAQLDSEAETEQKRIEVERQLQLFTEEARLETERLQHEISTLQRKTTLLEARSTFELQAQARNDQLKAQQSAAALDRERNEALIRAEITEIANRVKLALLERETEIARLQQEIRNLVSTTDLTRRMIEQLPELAEHQPKPDSLQIVQTGEGNALVQFLVEIRQIAKMFGVALNGDAAEIDED
ncbi:MAG: SPFH domain-containing protein [Anaerolineae bacterium]|jgi:hypothetical protein|nr:SPFH domain-containing protein [Anaerolineae bacterium]